MHHQGQLQKGLEKFLRKCCVENDKQRWWFDMTVFIYRFLGVKSNSLIRDFVVSTTTLIEAYLFKTNRKLNLFDGISDQLLILLPTMPNIVCGGGRKNWRRSADFEADAFAGTQRKQTYCSVRTK